jgi:hypothetical protein
MRLFRSVRWILMTLLLSLIPASSYAGVFVSVGFAPPPLVVYDQPPCPQPGLMWTPGYWGYGPDGYYWVPGAWVPAPYEGALWTPGYWGWSSGLYVWHGGYWGPHVGYYGGVNYGFGYMGIGFAGGIWRGHDFVYNTAVVHVNNVYVHNTYVDRNVVVHNTIVNDRHVAFSGGPGGINHAPAPEERAAMNERHLAPTSFQAQHMNSAMNDHNAYAHVNGGHPQNVAAARPLPAENHAAFNNNHAAQSPNRQEGNSFGSQPHPANQNQFHPAPQNNQFHAAPQNNQFHNNVQPNRSEPQSRPAPQAHPQAQHESHEHGKGR